MGRPKKQNPLDQLKDALILAKKDEELRQAIKTFGFSDPDQVIRDFDSLGEDPLVRKEFVEFIPRFLSSLENSLSPDLIVNNFERFASSVSSRLSLYSFLKKTPRVLKILFKLFETSPALAEVLIRNPEYFDWLLEPYVLEKSWPKESFRNEIDSIMQVLQLPSSSLNALKRYKRRMMLRIGVRDIMGFASLEETTRDLSFLADVCLEWAYRLSIRELRKKFGEPRSEDGFKISQFAVIGMGKLGGLELNYSSDIDIMFVYSVEGSTAGGSNGSVDSHTFFSRVAEKMLQILSLHTKEGYLYRVDMRLRPEGDTGPLVRSLESYETYYASWGQSWERQALIKARSVAGDEGLGRDFLERFTPFIYRKYMDYQAIEDMKSIKARIDYEVDRRGQKERDVKLGMGGIREVEFGLQILQLLYGGKIASLRQGNSLEAMTQLVHSKLLEKEVADSLKEAYIFLRRVENLLQLEYERQTHVLPSDPDRLLLLARRLGYSSREKFLKDHARHKNTVQAFYHNVFSGLMDLKRNSEHESLLLFLLEKGEIAKEEKNILKSLGFKNVDLAVQNLLSLAKGGEEKISTEVFNGFTKILPSLEAAFKKAFDPDQAMTGLARFVSSYKARSVFFKLLKEMPEIIELLVMTFGMSPFLTEILIRNPEFFDVIASGSLSISGLEEERHESLHEFFDGTNPFETKLLKLREYKNLELLRLGARDIMRLAPCMETIHGLSTLAEFVLNEALHISMKFFEETEQTLPPPFVVIGLGKLGGKELGYASDLDMMFVSEGDVEQLEKANTLGSILMDVLSKNRVGGYLYKIDLRLRPDGSKGPLVQSIETCQEYYAQSDSIWERMALSRARVVGGDKKLGAEVIKILEEFVFKSVPRTEQVEEIRDLRERIFEERCSELPDGFEVKSGVGGLLDIEFLAQFLQLKGKEKMRDIWETHTLKLLQKLSYQGLVTQDDLVLLVEAYLFYREVENALRLVKDRPTDFIPRDSEWAEGIQKKIGLDPDFEYFFEKLARFSQVVRYLYNRYVRE